LNDGLPSTSTTRILDESTQLWDHGISATIVVLSMPATKRAACRELSKALLLQTRSDHAVVVVTFKATHIPHDADLPTKDGCVEG